MTWVGPETVTSLLEAHGIAADLMQTPSFEGIGGWPVLLPITAIDHLRDVRPSRMPDEAMDDLAHAGVPFGVMDLGDPGVSIDRTTPRADLPPYVGPTEPPGGHVHEWGAQAADAADDGPLEGPALAPYGPAAAAED
jgi:hypothetical protein